MAKRAAGIDIGTNTILMVVADVHADGSFDVVENVYEMPRIGQGFGKESAIAQAPLDRASAVLREFATRMQELSVERCFAVATSAVRTATNQSEVLKALDAALGIPVLPISGEFEARLAFMGAEDFDGPAAVLDIGGGSTELCLGENNNVLSRISLEFGAVKLSERFVNKQPIPDLAIDKAHMFLNTQMASFGNEDIPDLTAVGGTPTSIANLIMAKDPSRATELHGFSLTREDVESACTMLFGMSKDEIVATGVVEEKRADVLPMGAMILREVFRHFGLASCKVSTRGIRYGAMLEAVEGTGFRM